MKNTYKRFEELRLHSRLISLEKLDDICEHFCYPINAKPIGFEECIMYCFIDGYNDMVFAVNPESCADIYVYPLAKSFEDFLRLILACGSANPTEQIIWMSKEKFDEHLTNEFKAINDEQQIILNTIKDEFNLEPEPHPYEYVKNVQSDFDDSKIIYSDEYYDVLGLER